MKTTLLAAALALAGCAAFTPYHPPPPLTDAQAAQERAAEWQAYLDRTTPEERRADEQAQKDLSLGAPGQQGALNRIAWSLQQIANHQ
jgi:hypothetical protein